MPFDEVVIAQPPTAGGGRDADPTQLGRPGEPGTPAVTERRLSPSEFFALPLALRLRHVIARTAVFLRGGVEIDAQAALAHMRTLRAAS
jgi:hypothetical protein